MILPNSLDLVAHQWHHYHHLGYIVVGLGFFLICIIEELIHLYERCLSNRQSKIENEQSKIVNEQSISPCHQDNQITRLITLVFALGVHYFFSKSYQIFLLMY
jgi:energy-converting hydrogenase Eha subunit H